MHSVEWLARIVYGAIVFVMAVTLAEYPTVVKLERTLAEWLGSVALYRVASSYRPPRHR
jgi:hypothetical protein